MRWLLALVVVFSTTSVSAIVISEPAVVRACRQNPSWDAVDTCFRAHGWKGQLERTIGQAKLFRLSIQADNKPAGELVDIALALFVEDRKGVHLGGLYEGFGEHILVLAAESETINKHTGIRIDLGEERPTTVSVDGASGRQALQLERRSLYCSGVSWECAGVVTWCEVLVAGKVYWTFRGEVHVVNNNMLKVDGDRSLVGTCPASASQFLGWPTTP